MNTSLLCIHVNKVTHINSVDLGFLRLVEEENSIIASKTGQLKEGEDLTAWVSHLFYLFEILKQIVNQIFYNIIMHLFNTS